MLSFVPPIKPEVWNDAERAVIKECASGASDEDVALWRLPRDGWVVVATADERLCVCAPHDGKSHNFWVWELVGIQGGRLVDLNATVPDFPRFEWLSFAREDRWRTPLTPAMKRKLRGGGLGFEPYRKGAKG